MRFRKYIAIILFFALIGSFELASGLFTMPAQTTTFERRNVTG